MNCKGLPMQCIYYWYFLIEIHYSWSYQTWSDMWYQSAGPQISIWHSFAIVTPITYALTPIEISIFSLWDRDRDNWIYFDSGVNAQFLFFVCRFNLSEWSFNQFMWWLILVKGSCASYEEVSLSMVYMHWISCYVHSVLTFIHTLVEAIKKSLVLYWIEVEMVNEAWFSALNLWNTTINFVCDTSMHKLIKDLGDLVVAYSLCVD